METIERDFTEAGVIFLDTWDFGAVFAFMAERQPTVALAMALRMTTLEIVRESKSKKLHLTMLGEEVGV